MFQHGPDGRGHASRLRCGHRLLPVRSRRTALAARGTAGDGTAGVLSRTRDGRRFVIPHRSAARTAGLEERVLRHVAAAAGWQIRPLRVPEGVLHSSLRSMAHFRGTEFAPAADARQALLDVFAVPRPLQRVPPSRAWGCLRPVTSGICCGRERWPSTGRCRCSRPHGYGPAPATTTPGRTTDDHGSAVDRGGSSQRAATGWPGAVAGRYVPCRGAAGRRGATELSGRARTRRPRPDSGCGRRRGLRPPGR